MRPLSASDLLRIWEFGESEHPEKWALTLLTAACANKTGEALGRLSIGRRNALLMRLWERSFGPLLEAYAECPECGERLECCLNTTDLRRCEPVRSPDPELEFTAGRFTIKYRLPNSMDLAEVAQCDDVGMARTMLINRCLTEARMGDVKIDAEELPDSVIGEIGDRMVEIDPLMEVHIDLQCPKCEHGWPVILDMKAFFRAEISAEAKRLLSEVHSLARAYGWREADILAMSPRRRQFYLRMMT